jgi:hypothetical protein
MTISLKQGNSHVLVFTLTNLSNLNNPTVPHPLYPAGFTTSGYRFRFVAKKGPKSDEKAEIFKEDSTGVGGIIIIGTTQGYIEIEPEDTKRLNIPGTKLTLTAELEMWNPATNHSYVIIDAEPIDIRKSFVVDN